ncbi:MAG TPA: alpha/beta fold hydrolase [Gaiellaceae bacterium]|nr:alpha/beta fold hydrolase [Gaiellaceae bacterium]
MRATCGHEPSSGLYFEVLGEPGSTPPTLFLHGGGGSGAGFRTTVDGRPGWAELLAARGEQAWVTDWPGCGRSGGRDPLAVGYEELVEGYTRLLEDAVARPARLVCHSMSGAITWKLVEGCRELVHSVLAVAASYPGNLAPPVEVVSDDGTLVRLRFAASGIVFEVRRDRLYHYSDAYVYDQGLAGSTRFPRERVDALRAGLLGIPPRAILQRLGHDGGLPRVERTDAFAGLRVLYLTGPQDPAHTREIDQATVDLLRSWGADADLLFLADRGIEGNGHFLFLEDNSDELLDLALAELDR